MVPKSPWRRRAAAIGLAIALLVSLAIVAVAPLRAAAGLRAQIEADSTLLASLEKSARSGRRAGGHGANASSAARANAALLKAATTGLAGAGLQKLLIGLAERTGGRPRSVQVLGAKPDGGLLRISVNVTISTDARGLRDFLYELETHTPLLFVDELTLRNSRSPAAPARRARRLDLRATMQVSGYMQKEPGS